MLQNPYFNKHVLSTENKQKLAFFDPHPPTSAYVIYEWSPSKSVRDVTISSSINVLDQQNQEVYFWTGIKEDGQRAKDVFINEYTNQQIAWDPNIYPGPLGNFTCTMVRGDYLVKKDCSDTGNSLSEALIFATLQIVRWITR